MNPKIIHEKEFKGLPIHNHKKSKYGYYEIILTKIYSIFQLAHSNFARPRVCHLVIDDPVDEVGRKIGRVLNRWSAGRHKLKKTANDKGVYYLLVHEVRPRTGQHHIHIAVFFDGLNWKDLIYLEEKAQTLSRSSSARVLKRDKKRMPLSVDPETGEINLDENGDPKRVSSSYYHDIKNHLEDAFERISYLAKVYSKPKPEQKLLFSCSRVISSASLNPP